MRLFTVNKCNLDKKVYINVLVEDKNIIIKVRDEGDGFDPSSIPDPTEPQNLLKDSGRGVYLMKVYMDDLKYNATPNGMETVLVLKLET